MKNLTDQQLIAEFMGFKLQNNPNERFYKNYFTQSNDVWGNRIEILHFDSDWNWLMLVVEKIENQYRSKFSKNTFPCVSISSICCKISFYGNYEEVITNIVRPTKIEAVYTACLEFIKWYNELNKK